MLRIRPTECPITIAATKCLMLHPLNSRCKNQPYVAEADVLGCGSVYCPPVGSRVWSRWHDMGDTAGNFTMSYNISGADYILHISITYDGATVNEHTDITGFTSVPIAYDPTIARRIFIQAKLTGYAGDCYSLTCPA